MRRLRWLSAAMALLLMVGPAGSAMAESMLRERQDTFGAGAGWTFLLLSAGAFAVASNGISERDKWLAEADDSYDAYEAATDAAVVKELRQDTQRYLDRAKAYESTANAALVLGVLFALTSYASFTNEPRESPILVSTNSIAYRYRF